MYNEPVVYNEPAVYNDTQSSDFISQEDEAINQHVTQPELSLKAIKRKKLREKKKLKKLQTAEGAVNLGPGGRFRPGLLPGAGDLSLDAASILKEYVPADVLERIWLRGLAGMGNGPARDPAPNAAHVIASDLSSHYGGYARQTPYVNQRAAQPVVNVAEVKPKKTVDAAAKIKKRKLDDGGLNDRAIRIQKIFNLSPEQVSALTLVVMPLSMSDRMTSHNAEHIRGHLEGLIFARSLEERRIKIKTFNVTLGRISILCADEYSFTWLKSNVAEIPSKDGETMVKYKAMALDEIPRMNKYTMMVDGYQCNVDQVFEQMKRNYGIKEDWIFFISVWNVRQGKVLKFGLTADGVKCLEVDDLCPYVGLGQYVVTRIGEDAETSESGEGGNVGGEGDPGGSEVDHTGGAEVDHEGGAEVKHEGGSEVHQPAAKAD